jgi:nitroreductase/dihydropteridine reductase
VLGLRARGLTAVVLAALGYRSRDDFNATPPRSRLPMDGLFTLL